MAFSRKLVEIGAIEMAIASFLGWISRWTILIGRNCLLLLSGGEQPIRRVTASGGMYGRTVLVVVVFMGSGVEVIIPG